MMRKFLFTSAAAFALMSGIAAAQEIPAGPLHPTQVAQADSAPGSSYSSNRTEKTVDGNGVQSEQSQSYSVGADGVKSTKSAQTVGPDGSESSMTHEERSASPMGQSSTTTTRSTTSTTGP